MGLMLVELLAHGVRIGIAVGHEMSFRTHDCLRVFATGSNLNCCTPMGPSPWMDGKRRGKALGEKSGYRVFLNGPIITHLGHGI